MPRPFRWLFCPAAKPLPRVMQPCHHPGLCESRGMPQVEGLRSPYDKTAGGLHHLGRMLDKIRLKQAGRLPEDFHRNYGLSGGLDRPDMV